MKKMTWLKQMLVLATCFSVFSLASCAGTQTTDSGEQAGDGEGGAEQNERLRMSSWSQPIAEQSNLYVVEEKGWFHDAGIDFEYIPGAGGGDAVKNILAGNAEIAFANVEAILLAAERGEDLKIIYNIYPENIFNVVSLAEHEITSVEDLEGEDIGVYSLSSGTYDNLKVLLHEAGMSEDDVNIVETGVLNFGPLMNEQVVATAATDTGLFDARYKGLAEVNVMEVKDVLNTPSDVFVVTEEVLAEKRDLLIRFLQVYRESVQYTMQYPQEAAEVAVQEAIDGQDIQRNREIIDIRNEVSINAEMEEKGLGWLDVDVLQEVEDTYVEMGLLEGSVGIKNMTTNELVEELE